MSKLDERPIEHRVLLIEDNTDIAEEIRTQLRSYRLCVQHAADRLSALDLARSSAFDAMIVDRMLPDADGLKLLSELRELGHGAPALVLSALSSVDDRVSGLKGGGDDYLIKPFAMAELAARLEVMIRRPRDARETVLTAGPLRMDLITREVYRGTRMLALSHREYSLLEYMARRPNQTITRAMVLEQVWKYRHLPDTNLVDVHMSKLRRKVDASDEPALLHNVRGVGFVLRIKD